MKIKRTISLRLLFCLIATIAVILSLNSIVESKASEFLEFASHRKIDMNIDLEGKFVQLSNVALTDSTDLTRWFDVLLLRRKYMLRYNEPILSAEGDLQVTRVLQCTVNLLGEPEESRAYDMLFDP